MDTGLQPTRREALLQAGALVLGALGFNFARLAVATPVAAAETVLTIYGSDWHHLGLVNSLGDADRHGERLTLSGVLSLSGGERLGVFRGTSFFLDGSLASGVDDACIELHTFDLANGTIAGMGVCKRNASTFTVVGGTGAYLGAQGTYSARQSPFEFGGDGTAEFVFRLM